MKKYFVTACLLLSTISMAAFQGSVVPNRALKTDSNGNILESSVSSTELGYLSGATGNIQNQLSSVISGYLPLTGGTLSGMLYLPQNGMQLDGVTGGMQFGSTDAFSRRQIWNYEPDSVLRMGSLGPDGDAYTIESQGIVVYGKDSAGDPMDATHYGIGRVKAWEFYLLEQTPLGQFKWFDAAPSGIFMRDVTGNVIYSVSRPAGALVSNSIDSSSVYKIGGVTVFSTTVNDGVAIGRGSSASTTESVSIGKNTSSTIGASVSLGSGANSAGNAAIAIGNNASSGTPSKSNTIAIGSSAGANGERAIAIGFGAFATAQDSVELGIGTNSTSNTLQFKNYNFLDASGNATFASINGISSTTIAYLSGATANIQSQINDLALDKMIGISTRTAYVIPDVNYYVTSYTSGLAHTITLPTAVGKAGGCVSITADQSSTHIIDIATTGGQTIDGLSADKLYPRVTKKYCADTNSTWHASAVNPGYWQLPNGFTGSPYGNAGDVLTTDGASPVATLTWQPGGVSGQMDSSCNIVSGSPYLPSGFGSLGAGCTFGLSVPSGTYFCNATPDSTGTNAQMNVNGGNSFTVTAVGASYVQIVCVKAF